MLTHFKQKFIDILIIFVLSLTPLLWFNPGYLITSGDIFWPLKPVSTLLERTYLWYPQFQLGADASVNAATIPFYSLPAFFQKIGFDVVVGEQIAYIFWFFLTGLAMYFLIGSIIDSDETWARAARLMSVITYVFNFYLFSAWPRFQMGLSIIFLLPIFLGILIRRSKGKISYGKAAAILSTSSIIAAAIGVQPPLIITLFLALFSYVAVDTLWQMKKRQFNEVKTRISFFIFLVAVFLLSSMFWIMPLANYVFLTGYASSKQSINVFEVFEVNFLLAWESKYSSITNAITNLGDVVFFDDWYGQYYYPLFVLNKTNPIFNLAKFILPVLAYSSILFSKKKLTLYFAFLSIIGVFLSKGIHPPLGSVFMWLIENVPGFWVYRSPWQKFAILTTLGYSVLIGIASGKIYRYLETFGNN